MKYVFFGTPEFAAIILEKLINAGFIPEAIICNPDKPVGRKKILSSPLTKVLTLKHNIPVFQPEGLKIENWKLEIGKIKNEVFDFFVVAAYSKILPKEILAIPRLGTIGVHPSLLPKYRGSSPIQTAILNGDEITGTTLYFIDEKMDHGPILAQRELKFPIFNFQFSKLHNALAELSADLLIQFLRNYENIRKYEKIEGVAQDESQATYTKKFSSQNAFIEPKDLEKAQTEGREIAEKIERKIRALNPEPGVWTQSYENTKLYEITKTKKRVKLLEAEIKDGKLKLKKIQIEGKNPINI